MTPEVWKAAPGYEGLYEVSNHGHVRGVPRMETCKNGHVRRRSPCVMKPFITPNGYVCVHLSREGKSTPVHVHGLVAQAFLGPRPTREVVRHLDGDKRNNTVGNLAYGTQSENLRDWPRYGGRTGNQKLTAEQVSEIRKLLADGGTLRGIAALYGVAHGTINAIKQGRTFSYI